MLRNDYIARKRQSHQKKVTKLKARLQKANTPPQSKKAKPALSLLDVLQIHDIRRLLTAELNTADFLSLSNSSKALQSLKAERWDINRLLKRFVDDPLKFRALQANTDAIITGPQALAFAEGRSCNMATLSVNIFENTARRWRKFLKTEGYELMPRKHSQIQLGFYFETLFFHKQSATYGEVTIKLDPFSWHPVQALFDGAKLSACLTFISSHHIYVPFAHTTLVDRRTCELDEMSTHTVRQLELMGWSTDQIILPRSTVQEPPSRHRELSEHSNIVSRRARRLGDNQCCRIMLDSAGLGVPSPAKRFALFEFYFEQADTDDSAAYLFCENVEHPLLRHSYMSYSHPNMLSLERDGVLRKVLSKTLNRLLPRELARFKPKDRMPGIILSDDDDADNDDDDDHDGYLEICDDIFDVLADWREAKDRWTPPEGWHYYDDALPEMVEKQIKVGQENRKTIRAWHESHGLENHPDYPSDDEV